MQTFASAWRPPTRNASIIASGEEMRAAIAMALDSESSMNCCSCCTQTLASPTPLSSTFCGARHALVKKLKWRWLASIRYGAAPMACMQ